MAKQNKESGDERQQRIQREQHRPEQDKGYDQAVQQPRDTANEKGIPPDQRPRRDI